MAERPIEDAFLESVRALTGSGTAASRGLLWPSRQPRTVTPPCSSMGASGEEPTPSILLPGTLRRRPSP